MHSLLGVTGPYLTKVAVDRYLQPKPEERSPLDPLLPEDPVDGLIAVSALYLAILLAGFAARYFHIHVMNLTGQRTMRDLRREIFAKVQCLGVPYFDRQPIGRIVTRITTDVDVPERALHVRGRGHSRRRSDAGVRLRGDAVSQPGADAGIPVDRAR